MSTIKIAHNYTQQILFSTNHYIISVLILIFFIIRTTGIAGYIQTVWIVPLFGIYIISLLTIKKKFLKDLIRELNWIFVSFVLLLISIVFKHGNEKLYITFSYLIYSIPFFLIGFNFGFYKKKKYFDLIIIGYFFFLTFFLLSKLIQVGNLDIVDRESFSKLFYTTSGEMNDLILFWPWVAIAGTLGAARLWFHSKNNIIKAVTVVLYLVIILTLLFSAFAAPVFLILITFMVFWFYRSRKRGRISLIISIPVIIGFFLLVFYIIGSGLIGDFGATTIKTQAFLTLLDSGLIYEEAILNQITSNRYTGILYSINQFFAAPIFGHGAYYESLTIFGNIDRYTTASGQHSFVFDTLAFFGLFGLSIIFILVKFVRNAMRLYRKTDEAERNNNLFFLSIIMTYFIANFLNPYFLASNMDNYIFICAGYFTGFYYRISEDLETK